MTPALFVTAEVSRLLGVSIDRLIRAHRNGRLPEPARAGHHRVYTPQDVEAAKRFFFDTGSEETREAGDRYPVAH